MRGIGLIGALLLTLGFRGSEGVCYAPDPARSRIWIEGRSTLKRFTCTTTRVEGYGMVKAGGAVQGQLVVAVQAFDCGKQSMNRDLQKALQADRFPEIRFEPRKVVVLETPTGDAARLDITGTLTIAGAARTVRFVASGQLLAAGRARLTGLLPLKLTDFDVKPPTALFGLIRVYDQITVHFDLTMQPVVWRRCAEAVADSLNPPRTPNQTGGNSHAYTINQGHPGAACAAALEHSSYRPGAGKARKRRTRGARLSAPGLGPSERG